MGVFCLITIFASLGFDSLDLAVPHVFMGFAPSFIGISIFFFFVETHCDEPYVPQDNALRHRGLGFYAAVAVALIFIPCFTFRACWYGGRSLLGWMPVGLAASSLALNIAVTASNRRLGMNARSPWSRFALIYAGLVAFIYPFCHSYAFALDDHGALEDYFGLCYSFSVIIVGCLALFVTMAFYLRMNGASWKEVEYEVPLFGELLSTSYVPPQHDASTHAYRQTGYKPMDLYRSSYEEPDPYREEIYRQYDASRRVSEDIQQFHESHPDADLSDHYSWEDILDAQTDGYLDDDKC